MGYLANISGEAIGDSRLLEAGRTEVNEALMRMTGVRPEVGARLIHLPLDSGDLALLSPSCRLPVASLSLFWHF